MAPEEWLVELGGTATRAALLLACDRAAVDRALRERRVIADARGRYALPVTDDAVRLAHAMSGLLCLESAALHHGWEVMLPPDKPHLLLPTKRKVRPELLSRFELHRGEVHEDDRSGVATGVDLTLLQCLRRLPYVRALVVADSALRHGVPPSTLARVAAEARGPGSPQVCRVVAAADADSANGFESALRGITHGVPGLHVRPQRTISSPRQTVRPDLVDEDLGIVLEADSFEWHGDRAALARDARRYNLLLCDGWLVLRFAWEHVVLEPDHVREVLVAVVAVAQRRSEVPAVLWRAA